jgi:hypothetical protein
MYFLKGYIGKHMIIIKSQNLIGQCIAPFCCDGPHIIYI